MSDNMTLKQQNLSSIHMAAGTSNTAIVPTSLLLYLTYIKYVHITYMKILSDIQELIWMCFLPLMESRIYKFSANSVNPSTFAVSGSTIKW